MCVGMHVNMCMGMHTDMCIDMCMHMCTYYLRRNTELSGGFRLFGTSQKMVQILRRCVPYD